MDYSNYFNPFNRHRVVSSTWRSGSCYLQSLTNRLLTRALSWLSYEADLDRFTIYVLPIDKNILLSSDSYIHPQWKFLSWKWINYVDISYFSDVHVLIIDFNYCWNNFSKFLSRSVRFGAHQVISLSII